MICWMECENCESYIEVEETEIEPNTRVLCVECAINYI